MFLKAIANKKLKSLRLESIQFYRQCLRAIRKLDSDYQKMYYDYTRLKYDEHAHLKDEKKIRLILNNAKEELDWLNSVLVRKGK